MQRRVLAFTRMDRYLLGLMLPRMVAVLVIALAALLLERLLRLFDLMTGHGTALGPLFSMLLSLLPHYLGLALPIAFCLAILTAMGTLGRDNEIDVLESSGWSLRRIGAPYIALSGALAVFCVFLFGVAQPYGRYAYSEIRYAVMNAGWNGRIEPGVFMDIGDGAVLSAARIDGTGRVMDEVFVLQSDEGRETALTARTGVVSTDLLGTTVHVLLRDGTALTSRGASVAFDELLLTRDVFGSADPFRPRGDSERELTFSELLEHQRLYPDEPRYAAEFHARLVRLASLVGIALMAVPLGVTGKRTPLWPRIAVALVILTAYDHLIKMVEGLADLGRVPPGPALWGLCVAFLALTAWLYLSTPGQGAASPLRAVFTRLEATAAWLATLRRRRAPAAPGP